MTARTQQQILDRIAALEADGMDVLGFARTVLIEALDYEHARPFLRPETTADEWAESGTSASENAARAYLAFAIGKIRDHRGISAGRSVDKLREYAWLLGRDDVVAAMDAADYPQYGTPKVKAFAEGMGWEWPTGDAELDRMADGDPCRDDCDEGCSW